MNGLGPTRVFVPLLAAAMAVELVLLRLLTRTFVNIPGLERLEGPVTAIAETGRFAYYLSVVLVPVVGAMLVVRLAEDGTPGAAIGAAGVGGFLVAAGAGRLGLLPNSPLAVATLVTTLAVGLSAARHRRNRLPLSCVLIASTAAGVAGLPVTASAVPRTGVEALLFAAEWAAVGFAVTAPLLLDRTPGRGPWVTGAAVGVVTALMLSMPTAPTRILLLWTTGTPGTLPAWAYGIAIASVTATALEAVSRRRTLLPGGLLLLVGGGVGLVSTYQSALVVVGLALIGLAAGEGDPARTPDVRRAACVDHGQALVG